VSFEDVIMSESIITDFVRQGSIVTMQLTEAAAARHGEEIRFRIGREGEVSDNFSNPPTKSEDSEIGRALIGRGVGDTLTLLGSGDDGMNEYPVVITKIQQTNT
jgi:transcription elongation GreA/GreB family factor